jgi:hypothetical protein
LSNRSRFFLTVDVSSNVIPAATDDSPHSIASSKPSAEPIQLKTTITALKYSLAKYPPPTGAKPNDSNTLEFAKLAG